MKNQKTTLSSLLSKKRYDLYLKDPIHKEINFSSEPWIAEFVYCPELVRLQDIKQLGVSFKTFNSATHSRYMHSLGAFQVAQKFAKHFEKEISTDDKKLFLIAALLHDIGHGPFSHVFEQITNVNHEEMTRKIVTSDKLSIKKLLKKNKISVNKLIDVYLGHYKQEWISKLISSNLDVDRIDYLLRDSYHIGTYYASIDIDYLIERSILSDTDICFYQTTKNYIESFLFGRYYMHLDIYDNKNSYIYLWSLKNVFERLKEIKELFEKHKNEIFYYDLYEWIVFEKEIDVENYILLNDNNLTAFIDSLKCMKDKILDSFSSNFVLSTNEIIAINWTKENYELVKNETKDSTIDKKYLYAVCEKNKKNIYTNGDKNSISIYNTYSKKIRKFDVKKLIEFNKGHKNHHNKIILINKNLIN